MAAVASTSTIQAQWEANTCVTDDIQGSVLEQQVVYPPLPPVKVNRIWVSWEEAYGPVVMLPSNQDNSSRRMGSSRLRNQPVLETLPYTRSFADPSSRSYLLTGQYPPLQIDFFHLQKLSDQNASQIPPPSTNLTLTLLKSEDSGGVYQTGIEGTIANGIEQNYTVYKRIHKFTGDIYMETHLLRKACQQYFYIYDYSSPVNAYCFQFNPGICMIANVANAGTNTLDVLSDNYIEDVKNRNNSTNDMHLSSGIKDLILDMTHKTSIEEESLQNVFYEILSDYNKN